jgi:hypothetical protein
MLFAALLTPLISSTARRRSILAKLYLCQFTGERKTHRELIIAKSK